MSQSVRYADLPFDEAIEFLRKKINLPTETWLDIWQEMHARSFVVAGAMRKELLEDLREAVEKGIAEGTTIEVFRESFDKMIEKYGWAYNGGKAWRTAVIFNTNLSVAYSVGHYRQMMDPDVLKARPWWRYVGSSSEHPREEHKKWYGVTLPADDPWWNTHYPPNDWGCKCGVVNQSGREIDRLKKEGVRIIEKRPDDGEYEWINKETGEIHTVPVGIGPGWAYNPGKAAWSQGGYA